MEKAVAIVCEYNPLHAGHAWQLSSVRAKFPDKPIVLLMSGNFVQRAEAAVCDHTLRARAALECGADLVLLLPFPYSTFGAQGYAASAVHLLAKSGVVDTLAFGAECGDEALLKKCAKALCSATFEEKLSALLKEDSRASYAHLRALALESLVAGAQVLLKEPNNILSIEYLAAIEREGAGITPFVLPRSPEPSATALRARIQKKEALTEADVPCDFLREELSAIQTLPQEAMGKTLLAALRAGLVCEELSSLGARVGEAARAARDFEDFVQLAKTRKITSARIRRGVLHAYFGVREGKVPPAPYTILLGANEKGRAVLSFIYNIGELPVFTKPSAPLKQEGEIGALSELNARADSVYALLLGREGAFYLKQNPVIVNKL
ncbi:MAG: nucleotidyltransferase family protein [Clostridia bacterium]|nr:nucleotidyltransferase family protein [Clostridia bacterium]